MGKRHWIAGAIKHKGALKGWMKRNHTSGVKGIRKAQHAKSAVTRRRANLAMTLRSFH